MAENRPQRKILGIWRLTLVLAAVPPAFLCSFLLEPGGAAWMILTAAWVLLFLLLYLVWLPLYYRSIRFRVGERAVLLRSGVLLRKTAVMPVAAIQFTGLRAQPGERILGLCTLQLVAAGARLRLPGLPRGEAEGLAARLANTGEGRP